jgi:hypothetical protein
MVFGATLVDWGLVTKLVADSHGSKSTRLNNVYVSLRVVLNGCHAIDDRNGTNHRLD